MASNAGGVGKKRDSERISLHTLHTGLQCCKSYESRSVKNKAATDGIEPSTHGGVRRSLFSQDDDEVFVTGSMLRGVFIATQLNSTSSCRHVHMQREQLSPISSERSDPVDSVCRS